MPSPDVLGAHYVLRQSTSGHTHRLQEVVDDAHANEVTVRREIDALALDGQVKRLYVGEHVMVKKTDGFDPDNAPDVDTANRQTRTARGLDPSEYERPGGTILDPRDDYSPPVSDGLKPSEITDDRNTDD